MPSNKKNIPYKATISSLEHEMKYCFKFDLEVIWKTFSNRKGFFKHF